MNLGGPLLLVGSGKMGGAMLRGWLDRGLSPAGITVVEPNSGALGDFASTGLAILPDAAAVPAELRAAAIVLAVKPQMMDAVLPAYARFVRPETVFLSVAAGKTIAYFERHLGAEAPIVRAMPNTPAAVGRGITVLSANGAVTAAQKETCSTLLGAVGEVAWVESESLLDAVTAVSGGGPAYVFLMIECLAEAGVEAGLPSDLAMRLARATVAGAGELARRSEEPASVLRQNVTSPGGTTIEALNILMAPDGMRSLFIRAIAAAARRSRELAD